jgi:hypothetical protein
LTILKTNQLRSLYSNSTGHKIPALLHEMPLAQFGKVKLLFYLELSLTQNRHVTGSGLAQYSALVLKAELGFPQHSGSSPTLCVQSPGYKDHIDRTLPPTRTPTCAEWDGIDEAPWNLLSSSSVPKREMICIKNVLFVASFQEVPGDEKEEYCNAQGQGRHSVSNSLQRVKAGLAFQSLACLF